MSVAKFRKLDYPWLIHDYVCFSPQFRLIVCYVIRAPCRYWCVCTWTRSTDVRKENKLVHSWLTLNVSLWYIFC